MPLTTLSSVSINCHQKHDMTITKLKPLCFYGTAIRANFSLVHILCMRPVYRMQCGCMPCAHQRAANNHKEQTKPDTSCQTTQQTHCAPSSSGLAFFFFAGIFHQSTFYCFNNLTWVPPFDRCPLLSSISDNHLDQPSTSIALVHRADINIVAKRATSSRGERTYRVVFILVPCANRIFIKKKIFLEVLDYQGTSVLDFIS